MNVFSTIGGYSENGIPDDIAPMYIEGFSVVLADEINHRLDPDYIYPNAKLNSRRSQLLKQSGLIDFQFLRSMVGSQFFQNTPQEFIASIANQWFCSSEHTFQLALIRANKGYLEPINQVLYFCELYSLGTDTTRFYTIDEGGTIRWI